MKRSDKFTYVLAVALGLASGSTPAATIANWDFEDGVTGRPFTDADGGASNGSGGSVDTVNGILMRGWNNFYGPSWTSSTASGSGLAMSNADKHQDGYVTGGALHNWAPTAWTIEAAVYLEDVGGWNTLIGRDGSSQAEPESDFYLVNNGIDDKFRINYDSAGGQRWVLDGNYTVQVNTWYALAAMSDGSTLSMWLDDGSGYAQIGSLDISAQTPAQNAFPNTALNWTFGRGWFGGSFVDHIDGKMDNIRFSDQALTPSQFIPLAVPEPSMLALGAIGAAMMFIRRRLK